LAIMGEKSKHHTFRLPAADARLLANRARSVGLSVGRLARLLVIQAINDSNMSQVADELTRFRQELAEIRERVRGLQESLAIAIETLLVDAGHAEPDEAAVWVRDVNADQEVQRRADQEVQRLGPG
jgi:hypothetical protein